MLRMLERFVERAFNDSSPGKFVRLISTRQNDNSCYVLLSPSAELFYVFLNTCIELPSFIFNFRIVFIYANYYWKASNVLFHPGIGVQGAQQICLVNGPVYL